MANLGYALEHFVETELLRISNQTSEQPVFQRTYRVSASGAMRGDKGDVRTKFPWSYKQWLIECKSRRQGSSDARVFKIEKDWLEKCFQEAVHTDHIPVFIFSFKGRTKNRVWCLFWDLAAPEQFVWMDSCPMLDVKCNKKSVVLRADVIDQYAGGFKFECDNQKYTCATFEFVLLQIKNLL